MEQPSPPAALVALAEDCPSNAFPLQLAGMGREEERAHTPPVCTVRQLIAVLQQLTLIAEAPGSPFLQEICVQHWKGSAEPASSQQQERERTERGVPS